MKRTLIFLFIAIWTQFIAQNLVPNPSFEFYSPCPNNMDQIAYARPWFMPTTGTSDFFHVCAYPTGVGIPGPNIIGYSSSYAHSGNGMAGLCHSANVLHDMSIPSGESGYREYIAVKLNAALTSSVTYYVTFYIKLADSCVYAGNVSMFISKDSITKSKFDTISAIPQINNVTNSFVKFKSQWAKISGNFVAKGSEKFIYIGNFKPNITNDTSFVGPGGRAPNGLRVNFAYYYIDDVCLSTNQGYCNLWTGIEDLARPSLLRIFPNPSDGIYKIAHQNSSDLEAIEVVDVHGRLIKTISAIHSSEFVLDISAFESGVYFLKIYTATQTLYERVVKY